MNQSEALDSQIRERRGELHAITMDLRNTCLDARSELYKTHDVVGETDKIIKAHDRAMSELEALIKTEQSALLNRIEAGLPRRKKFKNGGLNITKLDDERVAVHNLALEEIKQLIKQERDKL